jgi:hypothetical protein
MSPAVNYGDLANAATNGRRHSPSQVVLPQPCGPSLPTARNKATQTPHNVDAVNLPLPDLMNLRTLLDAAIAFVVMGLTEAVLKPLAKSMIDRPLRRALPYVYEQLDNEMPTLLRTTTPEVMAAEIGATIARATGNPATARQIEQVAQLYDPLKAVLRNVSTTLK